MTIKSGVNHSKKSSKKNSLLQDNALLSSYQQQLTSLEKQLNEVKQQNEAIHFSLKAIRKDKQDLEKAYAVIQKTNDYLKGKVEVWEKAFMLVNKINIKPEISHDYEEEIINNPSENATENFLDLINPTKEFKKKTNTNINEDMFASENEDSIDDFIKKNPHLFEYPK